MPIQVVWTNELEVTAMVPMGGIEQLSGPGAARLVRERDRERAIGESAGSASQADEVRLSPEARQAAELSRVLRQDDTPDARTEAIERAKENLEQGTYRIQSVVLQVASRVEAYL